MHATTLLILCSLAGVFAFWVRLERVAFERPVQGAESDSRPRPTGR